MKKILYWIPTITWMLVIFIFSARPAVQASGFDLIDFLMKKTAHFGEYFIFTVLLYYSLKNTTQLSKSKALILSLIIAVFYAASDEYHQTFVSGREGRLRDVFVDSAGSLASILLLAKK